MTFYYSPAKEDSGFASISSTRWKEANSRVQFEEMAISEGDDAYYLSGWCTGFTDIKNFRDQAWQFNPGLIALKVSKKDYSRTYNGETKNYAQSALEKIICEELATWDKSKIYSGTLNLTNMDTYEPDEWANVDEIMKKALIASMLKLKPVIGELKYLTNKKFEVSSAETKPGRGSGRIEPVSEYDKLKSKEKFLLEKYQEYYPEDKLEKLCDLVALVERPGFYNILTFYDYLLNGAKVAN